MIKIINNNVVYDYNLNNFKDIKNNYYKINNYFDLYIIKLKDYEIGQQQFNDFINSIKKYNYDIKINIFDAVRGDEGYKNLNFFSKDYNLKKRFNKKLIKHKGRIGCLASHLMLWILCIKKNKNLLILENDVKLVGNINKFINLINKKNDKDLLLLDPLDPYDTNYNENIKNNKNKKLDIINGHTKKRNTNNKLKGAYCYIITPNGANKILNYIINSDEWLPADYYFDENILNIGTTNKTIFKINENYKAGIISTTKNFNL